MDSYINSLYRNHSSEQWSQAISSPRPSRKTNKCQVNQYSCSSMPMNVSLESMTPPFGKAERKKGTQTMARRQRILNRIESKFRFQQILCNEFANYSEPVSRSSGFESSPGCVQEPETGASMTNSFGHRNTLDDLNMQSSVYDIQKEQLIVSSSEPNETNLQITEPPEVGKDDNSSTLSLTQEPEQQQEEYSQSILQNADPSLFYVDDQQGNYFPACSNLSTSFYENTEPENVHQTSLERGRTDFKIVTIVREKPKRGFNEPKSEPSSPISKIVSNCNIVMEDMYFKEGSKRFQTLKVIEELKVYVKMILENSHRSHSKILSTARGVCQSLIAMANISRFDLGENERQVVKNAAKSFNSLVTDSQLVENELRDTGFILLMEQYFSHAFKNCGEPLHSVRTLSVIHDVVGEFKNTTLRTIMIHCLLIRLQQCVNILHSKTLNFQNSMFLTSEEINVSFIYIQLLERAICESDENFISEDLYYRIRSMEQTALECLPYTTVILMLSSVTVHAKMKLRS